MKFNFIFSFVLLSLLAGPLFLSAQNNTIPLKTRLQQSHDQRNERITHYLNSIGDGELVKIEEYNKKGWIIYDIRNGRPRFQGLSNKDAAAAIGITQLRNNSDIGTVLEGEGIEVGIWDGGLIRTTHQEFAGRIKYFDAAGGGDFSFHATGVAGTLLGKGIVAGAQGMAPKAIGVAYDFNNDEVEMVQAQDLKSLILSNHSYGQISGWDDGTWFGDPSISSQEDYSFGLYDNQAKSWDEIAYSHPNYLIVKSAGNDRGDSGSGPYPSDGPYDCISGSGVSKNILTVGAIQKSSVGYNSSDNIQMSSFSGWGPTDDGRIKPDLVGVGVSMNTAAEGSNDDYQIISGTSFSSPSVCGGLVLIQEFYSNRYNKYLLAPTLKAISIHTAKQAETAKGPSYRMGWGLLDVNAAVNFINNEDGVNKQIIEASINQGESVSFPINPKAGSNFRATIVWNDLPGTPPGNILDPTNLMLVNDLDLVLEDEIGNQFLPYILDPANPGLPPKKGDNFRDNLEQVYAASLDPRLYTLKLSHKNNLTGGKQNFSLIIEYESEDQGLENLYWVGNNGSWNKPLAWASSSGGQGRDLESTENKKIIIDDNSITQAGDTIRLDKDYTIGSMVVLTTKPLVIDLNGNDIKNSGNLVISSPSIKVIDGSVSCANIDPLRTYTINLDDTQSDNFDIFITPENQAKWTLENSTIDLATLQFDGGSLEMINVNGSIKKILSYLDTGTRFMTLKNSVIKGLSEFYLGGDLQFSGDVNSSIEFNTNEDSNQLYIDNINIQFPISISNCQVGAEVIGDTLESLFVTHGTLDIINSFAVQDLFLEGTSIINISIEDTLSIINDIGINNNGTRTAINGGENGKSYLKAVNHAKYCFENIDVNNVDLTGFGAISIGVNGTVENGANWSEQNCENLLFSDFTIAYPCLHAFSEIASVSEGQIALYEWSIDGAIVSDKPSFGFEFTVAKKHEIKLVISDLDGNTSTWIENIDIIENTIQPNEIIKNSTSLVSKVLGDSYQWYFNGVAIAGATKRIYPYNWEQGVFFVVAFKNGCNIKSSDLDLSTPVIDIDKSNEFLEILPNPFSNNIILNFKVDVPATYKLKVIDLAGRTVFVLNNPPLTSTLNLPLKNLYPGTYIVMIKAEENVYVKKIIKK